MDIIEFICWSCVIIFIITSIITLLALVKVIKLANESYLRKLFSFLILEVVVVILFVGKTAFTDKIEGKHDNLNGNEYHFKTGKEEGSLYWIDNVTTKNDSTELFYSTLFKWETITPKNSDNLKYFVEGTEELKGGLYDLKDNLRQVKSYWRVTFYTNDIINKTNEAKELGAKVEVTPFKVKNGKMSILRDPGGAYFALFEEK